MLVASIGTLIQQLGWACSVAPARRRIVHFPFHIHDT
jgi:hypothetical protein